MATSRSKQFLEEAGQRLGKHGAQRRSPLTTKQTVAIKGGHYIMHSAFRHNLGDKTWRWIEFLALYFGLPLAVRLFVPPQFLLPTLWLAALAVWLGLGLTRWPQRQAVLYGWDGTRPYLKIILLRFCGSAALLFGLLLWHEPQALFALPRQRPLLWLLIMILYPLVSVYPQGLIYRVLYELRYAPLCGARRRLSLVLGAVAFSAAHLPFGNGWALLFTFVGGLMFLTSFRVTGRTAAANLEHALYGNLIFTLGWGKYLYHGTQALAAAASGASGWN